MNADKPVSVTADQPASPSPSLNAGVELQEQFTTLEQQRKTAEFGMWIFLASEILFFGALFLGLSIYRMLYPVAFQQAQHQLSVLWGTINTFVLLTSSLAVAYAVEMAKYSKWRQVRLAFLIALLCGIIFLTIKAHEYDTDFHAQLFPGPHFNFSAFADRAASLFFVFYFFMTALHALHLIIGLGLISVLLFRIRSSSNQHPDLQRHTLQMTALYWHFVDLVWIFLFPLLYLVGRVHG